jgi:hypothetical protein
MVYDEGFEINLGEKDTSEFSSYFNFLKFSLNDKTKELINSKYFSHCYEALIGWFHTDNKKWGCYYGHKLGVDLSPTNGEASDKLLVIENVIKPAFIEKEINIKKIDLKISEKEQEKKILKNFNNDFNLNFDFENGRFMQTELELNNKLNNKFTFKTRTNTRTQTKSLLTLDAEFTNHEEVVNRINSMNLGWKAEVYFEFKGKTIADINKFSGRSSKGKNILNNIENNFGTYGEIKNRQIRNNLRFNKNKSKNFYQNFY